MPSERNGSTPKAAVLQPNVFFLAVNSPLLGFSSTLNSLQFTDIKQTKSDKYTSIKQLQVRRGRDKQGHKGHGYKTNSQYI